MVIFDKCICRREKTPNKKIAYYVLKMMFSLMRPFRLNRFVLFFYISLKNSLIFNFTVFFYVCFKGPIHLTTRYKLLLRSYCHESFSTSYSFIIVQQLFFRVFKNRIRCRNHAYVTHSLSM